MAPEFLMFVDERVEQRETFYRIIVSCLVVAKERWRGVYHQTARQVGAVRKARRLSAIAELLERTPGFALLAHADLPLDLVPAGEVDGTDDIPQMKRRDNVWSQAVLATATAVLACLRSGGITAAEIDLYYDPKSLKVAHRDAFETTLRQTLPNIAREDPKTGAIMASQTFVFGQVRQVQKRTGHTGADELQCGTAVAHHICSQAEDLIGSRKVARLVVKDHSDMLRSMVSKFTGGDSTNCWEPR